MLCKKSVIKNFAKFTGEPLCSSLFLNKVADLRRATLSKKGLQRMFFSVNIAKLLRAPILKNIPNGCF